MPTEGLESTLDWLDVYKAGNFRGSTTAEQENARWWYLGYVMSCTFSKCQDPTSISPLKDPSPLTGGAAPSTVLVVYAANQPTEAPSHVFFREHWTITNLFESLLKNCRLQGHAAETVSTIKSTFLWDGRAQLLRKDTPDDLAIFLLALRRDWRQRGDYFVENGCEIEMRLLVKEGA